MRPRFEPKELRLSALIRQRALELSYDGLANAIAEANLPATERKVDRRKLKKLVDDPENVVLTMRELRALDTYFGPDGEGLADKPIFERVGVLESLVERQEVTFLIGSMPRAEARRNDVSRWDTRSLASLLLDLGRESSRVQFRIEDVLRQLPDDEASIASEPWYELIKQPEGPSLISIGSPRACLATEVMLAEIFGITPFRKPGPFSKTAPFHFVWSPDVASDFPSSFVLTGEDLADAAPDVSKAVLSSTSWAFQWRGQVFGVERRPTRDSNFGVIVAQRRSSGRVFLVCAGISGPTTLAAANLVKEIAIALPRPVEPETHGRPIVVPVVADVGLSRTKAKGDDRVLRAQRFYKDPVIFTPRAVDGYQGADQRVPIPGP